MVQLRVASVLFFFAIVHYWASTFATIIFVKERPNPSTTASSSSSPSSSNTTVHCEDDDCSTTTAASTTSRHSPFQFPFPGRPQGAKIEFIPLASLLFGGGLGGRR